RCQMAELPKVKYSGKIREVKIGKPGKEVVVGGETGYSFYSFEGEGPNVPKLALQVLDIEPEEWAAEALAPFEGVTSDPVAWAKKCVDEYKADLVCLWLAGTDPNGKNLSAEHAAEVARKVVEAIDVPLIVWGVSNEAKNTEVLKAVAEACAGHNIVLGPVTEGNYKQIGAAAIAYKHLVAANSPIDINLAKQLNILLENLGVPSDKVLIDPTTGSVGYGMEYCYSIMERLRQAALTQNDDKLQYPIINNIAEEVWKTKEAKLPSDAKLGEASLRGVNLECVTALSALQAGSDLLILRSPKTLAHVRNYLSAIVEKTDLASMGVDLSLSAEPPKEAAKPSAAPAKPAPPKAEPKPAPKPVEKSPEVVKPSVVAEKPSVAAPVAAPVVPKPAPAIEVSAVTVSDDLSDQDVQELREMVAAFRAIRSFISDIGSKLLG
ncbi:MAG: acetyl-CoA decarbonylase/synthase complex subunit delta, partial [Desulfomonilaceae bacterium]